MDLAVYGRAILLIAVALLVIGLLLVALSRVTGGHGLPGDIVYQRDGVRVYIPIVTSIVISIILSLILSAIFWVANRGH